ncbi:MAG: response regulator, partial [Planctomycetota bacterium]|nr:response regulator [Planctomycetota bacterium]
AVAKQTVENLPPLKVLIAEDNLLNQRLVEALFSQRGHAIQVAGDGAEAVRLVSRQNFDLILMDVQMPNLDGIEATRAIRQLSKEKERNTLIVALTAHAGESDRKRCLEAGMDSYLAKPLRLDELMTEVKNLLQQVGLISRPGKAELSVEPAPNDTSNPNGVIDWQQALRQADNDVGLLNELVAIFRQESPRVLDAIEQSIQEGDRKMMSIKSHHLGGSFRVFACHEAQAAAMRLETLSPEVAAEPVFKALKIEYGRVIEALNQIPLGDVTDSHTNES